MNELRVTTYKGFSKVTGEKTLREVVDEVRSGVYMRQVAKIAEYRRAGEADKAANAKRQLPFVTATALYEEARQPWSIAGYNPIITIDIDHVEVNDLSRIRRTLERSGWVVACFLSSSQEGLKLCVHLDTAEAEALRNRFVALPQVTHIACESQHKVWTRLS